mgnify:CR=1 FL=1
MHGNIFTCEDEEKITKDGLENSSANLFPKNTILMAIYASPTLGRLGVLANDASCNQASLGLIANEDLITWQWLFYKLIELRDEFNLIAIGAGQQNISAEKVKNKKVLVPPKNMLDEFTEYISSNFEQRKILSLQINKLQEARDRLLPKLMSGGIEV